MKFFGQPRRLASIALVFTSVALIIGFLLATIFSEQFEKLDVFWLAGIGSLVQFALIGLFIYFALTTPEARIEPKEPPSDGRRLSRR